MLSAFVSTFAIDRAELEPVRKRGDVHVIVRIRRQLQFGTTSLKRDAQTFTSGMTESTFRNGSASRAFFAAAATSLSREHRNTSLSMRFETGLCSLDRIIWRD